MYVQITPLTSRHGVRAGAHLVLERALLGLVGHVDAAPGHVELPAVVGAAQPALLVAAEEQRGARDAGSWRRAGPPRRACRGRRPGPRRAGAPSSADRRARAARTRGSAGIQYWRSRSPIGRAAADAAQELVVFPREHGVLLAKPREAVTPRAAERPPTPRPRRPCRRRCPPRSDSRARSPPASSRDARARPPRRSSCGSPSCRIRADRGAARRPPRRRGLARTSSTWRSSSSSTTKWLSPPEATTPTRRAAGHASIDLAERAAS